MASSMAQSHLTLNDIGRCLPLKDTELGHLLIRNHVDSISPIRFDLDRLFC